VSLTKGAPPLQTIRAAVLSAPLRTALGVPHRENCQRFDLLVAVDAVLDLHTCADSRCTACGQDYPCTTVEALFTGLHARHTPRNDHGATV
jgi:hypothetical protein